jgi:hypothetical protein
VSTDESKLGDFEPAYRTGTAARLAGIPVETLRVWERRYRVVAPPLTPRGHRVYSAEDVSRLTLMKQLVDLGSPIGSIASLPIAALRTLRAAASAASQGASVANDGSMRPVRVALVGAARDGALLSSVEIVAACAESGGAAAALRGISADVVVIELPTLPPDVAAQVDVLKATVGARHAAVVYRFGRASLAAGLRDRGHTVTRAPLDADEIERICRSAIVGSAPPPAPASPLEEVPVRRFDDPSLARLARSLTTLYCECPHHVVELLMGIATFERYSAECVDRSPDDAALHRYLQRVAGTARVLFEDALVRIARAEGLALPVKPETALRPP